MGKLYSLERGIGSITYLDTIESESGKMINNIKQCKGLGMRLRLSINSPKESMIPKSASGKVKEKPVIYVKEKKVKSVTTVKHFEYTECAIDSNIENGLSQSLVAFMEYDSSPVFC